MFGRVITLIVLAAAIALGLVLQSTNPITAGPVGIFAVFFLMYVITVGCMTWLLYGLGGLTASFAKIFRLHPAKSDRLTMRRAYYYASVVSFAPIILLAIQSVNNLGIYEIGLVVLFVVIGVFYVKKQVA